MVCAPAIPTFFEKELRRFNPRLRVRFDHERALWVVEERGRTDGNWYYVFIWADRGPKGEYLFRPLPETPGPIIEHLVEIDLSRFDRAPRAAWKSLVAEMDGGRKRFMEAELAKRKDETAQATRSKWSHFMKGKRTFDMGREGA